MRSEAGLLACRQSSCEIGRRLSGGFKRGGDGGREAVFLAYFCYRLSSPSDQLSLNAIDQFPDVRHGSIAGDR